MKMGKVMQGYYVGWIAMFISLTIRDAMDRSGISLLVIIGVFAIAALICAKLDQS